MMKTVVITLAEDKSLVTTLSNLFTGKSKTKITTLHPNKQFRIIDEHNTLVRIYRVLKRNHPRMFKRSLFHKRYGGIAEDILSLVRDKQREYEHYLRKGDTEDGRYLL